jgi:hypothetical protein
MVKDKPAHKLRLRSCPMLHFHNFDHVQVDGISPLIFGVYFQVSVLQLLHQQSRKIPFGGDGGRIVMTASTTSAANCFASPGFSFVANEV